MSYFAYVTCNEEGKPVDLLTFSYKALEEKTSPRTGKKTLVFLGEFDDYQEMLGTYHSQTYRDSAGVFQWVPEEVYKLMRKRIERESQGERN